MTSKAERKRRKKAFITLAGGDQVEQRPTGRDRTHTNQPQPPADIIALQARAKHLEAAGVEKPSDLARSQMAGCEAGKALLSDQGAKEDRAALWQAVTHIRRVWVAYGRAIGAPNRYAQCLRVLLPTEQFEVSAASSYDDRPQEDKDRAAVSAYMQTHGWLMRGHARDMQACIGCVVDDQPGHDWQSVKRALYLVSNGMSGARA